MNLLETIKFILDKYHEEARFECEKIISLFKYRGIFTPPHFCQDIIMTGTMALLS